MDEQLERLLAASGFTIERELGRGGMGAVYLARQRTLDRFVAVKCMLGGDPPRDHDLWKRFVAEARLFRDLAHPNVVRVFDTELEGPVPFLVLEYIPGSRTLGDAMASRSLDPRQAAAVLTQILEALEYIHSRRIIHRDLKPANVLLGEGEQVKLIDFGMARVLDSDQTRQTQDGSLLGTLAYMPPEQMRGSDVTEAADIYSWALIAIEVLAGRRIFSGISGPAVIPPARRLTLPLPPVSKLVPGVDPRIDRMLGQCVDRDPAARPTASASLATIRFVIRPDSARFAVTRAMANPDGGSPDEQRVHPGAPTLPGSAPRRSAKLPPLRIAEPPSRRVWALPAVLVTVVAAGVVVCAQHPVRRTQPLVSAAPQRGESTDDRLRERLVRLVLERPGGIVGVISATAQQMAVDSYAHRPDACLDIVLGTDSATQLRRLLRREPPGVERLRGDRRLLSALLELQSVDDYAASVGAEPVFAMDPERWLGPYATTTEFPALDEGSVVLGTRGAERIKETRPGRWAWTLPHLPPGDPLLIMVFGNLHPKFLVRVTVNRSLTLGYRNASGWAGERPYVIREYRDILHAGLSGSEDYSRPGSLKGHVVLARRIPREALVTGVNTLDVSFVRLPGRLPRGARAPSALSEGALWHGYLAFR